MIRLAVLDDVPAVVLMGREFIRTTKYQDVVSSNPDRLSTLMTSLIESAEGLLMVSEFNGLVRGAIGMMVYDHPMSGDRVSSETFWWMNPEDRGGRDALRLVRSAEEWVCSKGAQWVHMVAPDQRVGALYERLGYQLLELHYMKPCMAASLEG
jgi:hypothetical protein